MHLEDLGTRSYFLSGDAIADGSRPIVVMRLQDDTYRAFAIDCGGRLLGLGTTRRFDVTAP